MPQTFRTTACSAHGHPEVTLTLAERVPVPNIENTLLRYFESQVARGVVFSAGQTIDFVGLLLKLVARDDGTLGVSERDDDRWVESVHGSLMQAYCRIEVARSFALAPEPPPAGSTAIVCSRLDDSKRAIMCKRAEPSPGTRDSGWYIGCTFEDHDHDDTEHLAVAPLAEVAKRYAWLGQFLALPVGTDLVVEMRERVSVPVLWRGEDVVAPVAGSYVAALNQHGR